MYIPRCVGKVIICGIKACSRYNVLSAAVPGPKAPKAGRSPARDRQTEGHNQAFCNQHLQNAAHLPYHFSHKRGK